MSCYVYHLFSVNKERFGIVIQITFAWIRFSFSLIPIEGLGAHGFMS